MSEQLREAIIGFGCHTGIGFQVLRRSTALQSRVSNISVMGFRVWGFPFRTMVHGDWLSGFGAYS